MAYAFIGMASLFGMTAAYVLLVRPPKVVYVPGETVVIHDQTAPPPLPTGSSAASGTSAPDSTSAPAGKSPTGGGRSAPDVKTAAPVASGGGLPDLSGFGNGGVPGPSTAGPSGVPANGATGELSSADISSVVSKNQTIIQRKCWQQALESRTKEGAANAKVNVKLMIGPSGDVQSASASGGDGFPGLADCIAGRIKSWKFPASSGSTPVSVPFVFAGQ